MEERQRTKSQTTRVMTTKENLMDTTNKVKHTPGPWNVIDSSGLFESYNEGVGVGPCGYCSRIETSTQMAIDVWGHKTSEEETRATANIIAAAPDLLSACACALDHPDEGVREIIRQAIKKATS